MYNYDNFNLMKSTIVKIEFISIANIYSWSHIGRNDSLDISNFINGVWTELKFTSLTGTVEEEWLDSPAGIYSNIQVSAVIRTNKIEARSILSLLNNQKYIYRLTDANNNRFVVGSIDFPARLTFKMVISELTISEYQITISNKSKHGIVHDISCSP